MTDFMKLKLRDSGDAPAKPFKMKDPVLEQARRDFKKQWGYKPVGLSLETIRRKLAGEPEPIQDTVIRREGKVPTARPRKPKAEPDSGAA